jgi:hypothetical protein
VEELSSIFSYKPSDCVFMFKTIKVQSWHDLKIKENIQITTSKKLYSPHIHLRDQKRELITNKKV